MMLDGKKQGCKELSAFGKFPSDTLISPGVQKATSRNTCVISAAKTKQLAEPSELLPVAKTYKSC